MFACTYAFGQDVPVLRCISLDNNDDVTLSWEQPVDTGADFNHYAIFYSPPNTGNFSFLSSVTDYNQTSVLINGSFANTGRFYVQQIYNGFADTSAYSSAARPILIGITTNGRIINLGWNTTGLTSEDSVFTLFKMDTNGTFVVHETLDYPLTAFNESIDGCSEQVTYRIESKGIGGCVSRSNTVEEFVLDDVPPLQTNLLAASVDTTTGEVKLEWEPTKSIDGFGYLVFYFEEFVRSDTIFGIDNLTHTYAEFEVNGLIKPETLSVAPFDSCFDSVSNWYNQAADSLRFQTMFIDSSDYDRCSGSVTLNWNQVEEGFRLGVQVLSGFRVYRKTQGEGSELIATIGPTDTLFKDSGLVAGNKYTYVIAPFDSEHDVQSLSNKLVIDLEQKNSPDFLYIESVVNDHESGKNNVNIYADTASETVKYGLWRSLRSDDDFIEVMQVEEGLSDMMALKDESGAANQTPYYYEVRAYDECDDVIGVSQRVKSMFITGDKSVRDLINKMEWTPFEGFDSTGTVVEEYNLVRVSSDVDEEIVYSTANRLRFEDDIVSLRWIDGKVCYYVEAVESKGNRFDLQGVSISNLACLEYPPKIFIPNAFSPDDDGINDVFLPLVNYIDPNAYHLRIFDRMGNLIYETRDADEGWNGGNEPNGVFAYHLSLANSRDELLEYTGKIHIVR